jgi:hypothetical protein
MSPYPIEDKFGSRGQLVRYNVCFGKHQGPHNNNSRWSHHSIFGVVGNSRAFLAQCTCRLHGSESLTPHNLKYVLLEFLGFTNLFGTTLADGRGENES